MSSDDGNIPRRVPRHTWRSYANLCLVNIIRGHTCAITVTASALLLLLLLLPLLLLLLLLPWSSDSRLTARGSHDI
jgi:hypothetical protein